MFKLRQTKPVILLAGNLLHPRGSTWLTSTSGTCQYPVMLYSVLENLARGAASPGCWQARKPAPQAVFPTTDIM